MTYLPSLRFLLISVFTSVILQASALSHWNNRYYHDTPVTLRDSVIMLDAKPLNLKRLYVEARGAMRGIGERSGLSRAYWGLMITSGADSIRLTIRHGNTDFGDILDNRFTRISVNRNGEDLKYVDFTDGFATSSGGYNTLSLEIGLDDSQLRLSGGDHSCARLLEIPFKDIDMRLAKVSVWSKGELTLSSLSVETEVAPESKLATDWTMEELDRYFASSTDPLEGYWEYLDRKNDALYARVGGRYLLAAVKNIANPEVYDLIYISGAETFASRWKPFMLKGRLLPTVFIAHYDLHWYDSTFEPITTDVHASVTDNAILTLSFPLLKTVVRFSKASDYKKRKTYKEQGEVD